MRCVDVQLAQLVDRHARAAGHDHIGAAQPVVGQRGADDHGTEAVGHHGQALLVGQVEPVDERHQVTARRHQVGVALDRLGRGVEEVGRVVVALPQDDGRLGRRYVEIHGARNPVVAHVGAVAHARHHHGHVARGIEVAEEHGVVLELGPVEQDPAAAREQGLEEPGPRVVALGVRRSQVHLDRFEIAGGPPRQWVALAHEWCRPSSSSWFRGPFSAPRHGRQRLPHREPA